MPTPLEPGVQSVAEDDEAHPENTWKDGRFKYLTLQIIERMDARKEYGKGIESSTMVRLAGWDGRTTAGAFRRTNVWHFPASLFFSPRTEAIVK